MNPEIPKSRRWIVWTVGVVVAAVVVLVGGPFVYIHFIEGKAPAKFHLSTAAGSGSTTTGAAASSSSSPSSPSAGSSSSSVDGTWKVASGSQAGYRIEEVLFGQSNTAVGRTNSVTGTITVTGTSVSKGGFTVDMTTVKSDRTQRDHQFQGRIMQTSMYPTSTFTLTKPIDLGTVPPDGKSVTAGATGDLTLHGTTRPVTFSVTAQRRGSSIQVTGSIPITFADWNISNPSFGGTVTTQDHGILEFLLNLSPA